MSRISSMTALLGLFASSTALAIPQTMTLSMSDPLVPGQPVTVVVDNAQPNTNILLVRSDGVVGAGGCPAALGGECMDITAGSGYDVLPLPLQTDANGRATFSGTLPGAIPAPQVWAFQAIDLSIERGSNPISRRVEPTSSCSDDPYEPIEHLSAVEITGDISARLCGNDRDTFIIDLAQGEVLSTTITYDDSLTNLDVEIFDMDWNLQAIDDNLSGEFIRDVYATTPGDHIIRVRRSGAPNPVSYDLGITIQSCPADDQDCDGILTHLDCDDFDPTSFEISDDADCDGVPTFLDCSETGGNCPIGQNCDPGDCASGLICDEDVGQDWGYPSHFDVCVECPAEEVLYYTPSAPNPLAVSSTSRFHQCDTGYIVEIRDLDDNNLDFYPLVSWGDSWPLPTGLDACEAAWAEATIERIDPNNPRLGWSLVDELRYEGQWYVSSLVGSWCELVPTTTPPTFNNNTASDLRITATAGGALNFEPGCSGICGVTNSRPVKVGVSSQIVPH